MGSSKPNILLHFTVWVEPSPRHHIGSGCHFVRFHAVNRQTQRHIGAICLVELQNAHRQAYGRVTLVKSLDLSSGDLPLQPIKAKHLPAAYHQLRTESSVVSAKPNTTHGGRYRPLTVIPPTKTPGSTSWLYVAENAISLAEKYRTCPRQRALHIAITVNTVSRCPGSMPPGCHTCIARRQTVASPT